MAVDDNEMITVYDTSKSTGVRPAAPIAQARIQETKGAPANLAQRDLFALGYPYFICVYDKYIAVTSETSDYGVILLELD